MNSPHRASTTASLGHGSWGRATLVERERATPWSIRIGMLLLALAVTVTTLDLVIADNQTHFSADWQTMLRLALCAACGCYGLAHRSAPLAMLGRFPYLWVVLFGVWSLLTTPLSIAPVYSVAACLSLWCMIFFVPAALSQLGARRTIGTIVVALLGYAVVSWGLYLFVPDLGRAPFAMPDGRIIYRVGGDAQQLGLQCAWAVGLMLILGFAGSVSWPRLAAPLGLCLLTVPLTQSRTAMLVCIAVVVTVVARRMRRVTLAITAGVAVSLACLVLLIGGGRLPHTSADRLAEKISRSGKAEEIYNLTGRTDIWAYAVEAIGDRPIFGWGYGASRQVMARDRYAVYSNFQTVHAHDLWLNVAMCGGFIGVGLLAAMFLNLAGDALARPNPVPDMILVFALLAGITEPILFGPMPRAHTVIWLLALCWRPLHATLADAPAPAQNPPD